MTGKQAPDRRDPGRRPLFAAHVPDLDLRLKRLDGGHGLRRRVRRLLVDEVGGRVLAHGRDGRRGRGREVGAGGRLRSGGLGATLAGGLTHHGAPHLGVGRGSAGDRRARQRSAVDRRARRGPGGVRRSRRRIARRGRDRRMGRRVAGHGRREHRHGRGHLGQSLREGRQARGVRGQELLLQGLPQHVAQLLGCARTAPEPLERGRFGRGVGQVSHRTLISAAKDKTQPHRQGRPRSLRKQRTSNQRARDDPACAA